MSTIDSAVQAIFPTVLMPRDGVLPNAENFGTRYVVASDGLWRQITLPWISVLHKIADSEVAIPYGEAKVSIELNIDPIPSELRLALWKDARDAYPNEMAAAYIWNTRKRHWHYQRRESIEAHPGFVHYREVELANDEYLVLDMHSHAKFPAYFSAQDDKDDLGSMRFSGVIGSIADTCSTVLRLNMLGKTWSANCASNGILEVQPC